MAEEQINVRKRTWVTAGKVFLKTVFAGVLCVIVYLSMATIFSGIGTKNIGEQIYRYDENSELVLVDEYYYDEESSDTQEETSTGDVASDVTSDAASDSESSENDTFVIYIRSDITPTANFFYHLLSIICMVPLLLCMPYADLWAMGDKDNNSVTFGRLNEDKFRGLKIGLLSAIPVFICYILLVLSKLGLFMDGFLGVYQWLNIPYIMVIQWITGSAKLSSEMAGWCLIPIGLLTLLVPAVCALGYYLGYSEISISEKLLYKSGKSRRRHHR